MSSLLSSNADFFFGFDLLYNTIRKAVIRKSDVLIALVHFILMKYSKFRCLGVGEDKTLLSDEIGSELLPNGWNNECKSYALRYKANEQLYVLLGYVSETSLILNLIDVKNHKISSIAFEPERLVKTTKGSIIELIPTAFQIADRVRKELIGPIYSGSSREVTTQTIVNNTEFCSSPSGVCGPSRPSDLPQYEANDLEPFGRMVHGNVYAFSTGSNLQGTAPQGLDHFGLLDRNPRSKPNIKCPQPPKSNLDCLQALKSNPDCLKLPK